MGLNTTKGNMYSFVTHTWNTVKGRCPHDCSYCYMKRFGPLKEARFDEKELKIDLGYNNFIFVGSSNDLFAKEHPQEWIDKTLDYCKKFNNTYLFQTKNPQRLLENELPPNSIICFTLETNRFYEKYMCNAPHPADRIDALTGRNILKINHPLFITIEPIMDFDHSLFVSLLKTLNPIQINIGANTSNNELPKPSRDKVDALIIELEKFTNVVKKDNLKRLK